MQSIIEELSKDIYNRLQDSDKLGIKQGEETLTDHILLLLARHHATGITVLKTAIDQTSKEDEKTQGTDWEWWIGSYNHGWIRVAIQAKKMNSQSKRYEKLAHKVGKQQELQLDILETFCRGNEAVGFYCFYNYTDRIGSYSPYWHCPIHAGNKQLLSWSFTPLANVKLALTTRGGRSFQSIHSFTDTLPMICLFHDAILSSYYLNPYFTSVPHIFRSAKVYADLPSWGRGKVPNLGLGPDWNPNSTTNILEKEDYPTMFYKNELGIYPKRIAIFDIEKIKS